MKRLLLTISNLFLLTITLTAQPPANFNYQAIARDESGKPVSGQDVGLQISILNAENEGTIVYQETFLVQTNDFGLINLQIGNGVQVTGDFQEIDWSQGPYFVKVAMDISAGSNYQTMGVSQLSSVPYALHALTAGNAFSGDYNDLINAPDLSDKVSLENPQEGDMLYYSSGEWKSISGAQEQQVLQFRNGAPRWTTVSFGDHDMLPPSVVIASVYSISHNSISIQAEVTGDGGANVTSRGLVYSTSENPTIDDNPVQFDQGTGDFLGVIEDLEAETTYFIRAFATNGVGTSLSDQVSVTTEAESDETTGTVNDVEGTKYNTVLINGQWWMAENLRTRKYNDESLIETGFSNSEWVELTSGAWAFFDNDPSFDTISGKLYNWYAAADPRGICPVGWRLPTDQEVIDLRNVYGGFSQAGGALKQTGTYEGGDGLWKAPNTGATNETGFNAVPSGLRIHGAFANRQTATYFWTSDEYGPDPEFARNFLMVYDAASLLRHNYHKHYGLSVRCVKN